MKKYKSYSRLLFLLFIIVVFEVNSKTILVKENDDPLFIDEDHEFVKTMGLRFNLTVDEGRKSLEIHVSDVTKSDGLIFTALVADCLAFSPVVLMTDFGFTKSADRETDFSVINFSKGHCLTLIIKNSIDRDHVSEYRYRFR